MEISRSQSSPKSYAVPYDESTCTMYHATSYNGFIIDPPLWAYKKPVTFNKKWGTGEKTFLNGIASSKYTITRKTAIKMQTTTKVKLLLQKCIQIGLGFITLLLLPPSSLASELKYFIINPKIVIWASGRNLFLEAIIFFTMPHHPRFNYETKTNCFFSDPISHT